jgi:hypothetical protein
LGQRALRSITASLAANVSLGPFADTNGFMYRCKQTRGLDRRPKRPRKYAAELVALAPEVILAHSSAAVAPLLQATRTVPIVFTTVADPVGASYIHRLVEILPRFSSKRQVVEISQQIESDISAYLVNGIGDAAHGGGRPDPLGDGGLLLNYVPILGTALGVLIFLLAGLLDH